MGTFQEREIIRDFGGGGGFRDGSMERRFHACKNRQCSVTGIPLTHITNFENEKPKLVQGPS